MTNHDSKAALVRQVVLLKALFLRGCEFARSNDPISRMLAIHIFDNVVEMMLATAAAHQGKQVRSGPSVPDLLKIVNPPLSKQLRDLHERRNGVHHAGDIPTQEDVLKYHGYVEDFLRSECRQISGIAFDDLSLADLVETERLKTRIKKAEESLRLKRYRDIITECDAILTDVFTEVSNVFAAAGQLTRHFAGGEEFSKLIASNYAEQFKDKEWYRFAKDMSRALLQVGQASTTMQFLDNLRSEFLGFRHLADGIEAIPEDRLKDAAQFAFDFVLKVILKWQAEGLI